MVVPWSHNSLILSPSPFSSFIQDPARQASGSWHLPFLHTYFVMAVQAQCPSNVLLMNNRNAQEGLDHSLQPQPGGFLDQSSYMFFNNGGINNNSINQRERGREVPAGNTTTAAAATMNHYTMQSQHQPPQLINLSQLHNNHHQQPIVVVSTGLRLSFGDQQLQQQQAYHHQQQRQQQQNIVSQQSPSSFLSILSEELASPIKRHRDELTQFLQSQGEQLRHALAEKRRRHYRALLEAAEESIARRLRDKESEVENATRRNAELEARAAELIVEAQAWQAKARAQEATAASLQAQLQQATMSGGAQDSRRGDDGIMCTGEVAEDAESAYVDPDRVVSGPSCKGCRKRVASVVLLPCRHLCVCTECDRVVQACPVCFNVRDSSVEVFLSKGP